MNSALSYQIGATTPVSPYNHVGLVLWTSNTDYLEIQLYSTGVKSSANTVQVALNNSSSLSGATNINTVTTAGTFGLVWLGFVNTSGSWQAQYSTDGSTWNNIGSAVNHSLFTRAGLNSFAAVSGANYAGAFDWFQSTLSPVAYTQTSYAWFTDADAAAPGVVLTSNNTPVTLTATGQHVRLRALVKISGQSPIDGSAFNLQYVDPGGGSCASPTGGTPASYTNVSTSTLIAFGTYASNTDQMNISSATGDPTDSPNTVVPEVFNKTNSLITNHQAALNNSSDGMWDFGLFDNGAVQGKTYCLRLIMNDGVTALGSYTNYPQITIYQAGPTTDQVMSGGQYFSGGVKQPFFWAK